MIKRHDVWQPPPDWSTPGFVVTVLLLAGIAYTMVVGFPNPDMQPLKRQLNQPGCQAVQLKDKVIYTWAEIMATNACAGSAPGRAGRARPAAPGQRSVQETGRRSAIPGASTPRTPVSGDTLSTAG